ncbi:MAG: hypothetical protein GX557_12390 [Chloroflexi bacterium]|nr:hypothetical protein [Chloroflexota bacterium]
MQRWYVLYTKPRQERELCARLRARGAQVYLPLMPHRDLASPSAALFPRYLFIGIDSQPFSFDDLQWLPGVAGLVKFAGEPATVDDAVIQHIEQRLAELRAELQLPFRPGQRVRLSAGHPLAPLDVIFERPCSDRKRAYALIEMLGRLTRCRVDLAQLEAVDALA